MLAAATNSIKHADGTSTVLKYNEPPEARKPTGGWRLYVFKGKEQVGKLICRVSAGILNEAHILNIEELLHLHRQSAYLAGRDRAISDIHIEHPSCSKQHAVIQFRQVIERNEFGDSKTLVKYVILK